jgi:hypothetical protein
VSQKTPICLHFPQQNMHVEYNSLLPGFNRDSSIQQRLLKVQKSLVGTSVEPSPSLHTPRKTPVLEQGTSRITASIIEDSA